MNRIALLASVAAAACAGAASAQTAHQHVVPFSKAELNRVDAAVADRSALATSLRHMGTDLRVPTGWDNVYEIGAGSTGVLRDSSKRYARISGGVAAVFPASEYTPLPRGTGNEFIAQVPAGTVYYIGGVPSPQAAASSAPDQTPPVATGVSTATTARLDSAAAGAGRASYERPRPAPDRSMQYTAMMMEEPVPATVLTNDRHRVRRAHEVLSAAARADSGSAASLPQARN